MFDDILKDRKFIVPIAFEEISGNALLTEKTTSINVSTQCLITSMLFVASVHKAE